MVLAPEAAPLEVSAEALSSTQIKITWKAPKKDSWNGKLIGYHIGYQEYPFNYFQSNATLLTSNYSFKTVDIKSPFDEEIILQRLNKFTYYSIIIQAFNSRGLGPFSAPVIVRTKEDGNTNKLILVITSFFYPFECYIIKIPFSS